MFLAIELAAFNALPKDEAEARLYECFADHSWAAQVAAGRPYRDVDALLRAAEDAWAKLGRAEWLSAFKAHPRIGESGGYAPTRSEDEQSLVRQASATTRMALANENRRYEARFGHVFLIAARGRSADDVLHALRQRINNDPAKELEIAVGEQRKITRQRLIAMLMG